MEATQALVDQMKPKPLVESKRPIAKPKTPKETHETEKGTTLPTIPEEEENKMGSRENESKTNGTILLPTSHVPETSCGMQSERQSWK